MKNYCSFSLILLIISGCSGSFIRHNFNHWGRTNDLETIKGSNVVIPPSGRFSRPSGNDIRCLHNDIAQIDELNQDPTIIEAFPNPVTRCIYYMAQQLHRRQLHETQTTMPKSSPSPMSSSSPKSSKLVFLTKLQLDTTSTKDSSLRTSASRAHLKRVELIFWILLYIFSALAALGILVCLLELVLEYLASVCCNYEKMEGKEESYCVVRDQNRQVRLVRQADLMKQKGNKDAIQIV